MNPMHTTKKRFSVLGTLNSLISQVRISLPAFVFAVLGGLSAPKISFAAPKNFQETIELFVGWIRQFTAVLFALVTVGFVLSVALFIWNSNDPKKQQQMKSYMIWSVIAFAVLVGVWGFVLLLSTSFFGSTAVGIPLLSKPQ